MFNGSVRIEVGDSAHILLWEDPWIQGLIVDSIAPAVYALVSPGIRRRRTIGEGPEGDAWVRDTIGELSMVAIVHMELLCPSEAQVPCVARLA